MAGATSGGVRWDSRLGAVVGARTATALEEALGVRTVGDLLSHYPRSYVDRGQTSTADDFVVGEQVTVVARVVGASVHPYVDKRTRRTAYRTEVKLELAGGDVWMTFFDPRKKVADWRTGQLTRGREVLLSGKLQRNSYKGGRWELTHPDMDTDVERRRSGLQPVYRTSGKLRSWTIESSVGLVLAVLTEMPERLPASLRDEHRLVGALQAVRWIHQPEDRRQAGAAAKRLRFEEAFVTQVALAQRRHRQRDLTSAPRTGRAGGLLDRFDAAMPFALTEGQRRVEQEILDDLARPHPMHRLLQGEVGSGKTVVALRAMLRVVDSGAQAALLAPTEVLAQQHHRSISALLGDLASGGMLGAAAEATRVTLLTGSMGAAARRTALLEAASGEAGIVIGTHALLEDVVQFAELGLVVVDEQHRFGVEQRAALTSKNDSPPHVLVMTATPIPRTVAMTVFGDLETSALTELPAGRSPIQTNVVPVAEQPSWLDRVWQRVREEVAGGRQVYVVCPRISGDDKESVAADSDDPLLDDDPPEESSGAAGSRPPLAAVEEVAPALAEGPLRELRVEQLHGRLQPDRKDAVMRAFAAGQIDVLVSTTVIEVGVDVGNATTMVVLDADRFGVSQLHQLRGRVGRGGHAGLCLLVTHAGPGSIARERLDAVAATTDGFALAELDLRLRREGDVLGSKQSGTGSKLQLLSVIHHGDVIAEAREAAAAVVTSDPDLTGWPDLQAAVAALYEENIADYLDKT